MSEVYVKEPGTKGKVLLRTTYGDLEVELWASECPKACRNFCTLILEGYYNGTIFHRVIKDYIVQGGDRTGTGDGCESIYGKPYVDEIHPRLKFRYRGMLGVASAGKGTRTNGSQFFITLGRAPTLDGKHTLFGRVVGETVYNLVRISEVQVDKNDRPLDPPRVVRAELTWDPFGDLEPRVTPVPPVADRPVEEQHRRAPVHNKRVLSFATADSEDEKDNAGAEAAGGGKSAHDLLNDPKLSKKVAYPDTVTKSAHLSSCVRKEEAARRAGRSEGVAPKAAEHISSTHGRNKADPASNSEASDASDDQEDDGGVVQQEKASKRQATIAMLKRDIAGLSSGAVPETLVTKRKARTALEELRQGYETRGLAKVLKGEEKRKNNELVQGKIKCFAERVRAVAAATGEAEEKPDEKNKGSEKEDGTFAAIWDEGDEESTADWLSGTGLKFHTSSDKAFKLESLKARENLEIFDPLAAKGNDEVLAEVRKRRSEQMRPTLRHKASSKAPPKKW
mmetsp:Transcript_37843/g.87885  ORF Transcript_37843/g.87885 Transcript_37843/m.87885 type:complete len:508 (+) Transcript_37843:13-1536(+)